MRSRALRALVAAMAVSPAWAANVQGPAIPAGAAQAPSAAASVPTLPASAVIQPVQPGNASMTAAPEIGTPSLTSVPARADSPASAASAAEQAAQTVQGAAAHDQAGPQAAGAEGGEGAKLEQDKTFDHAGLAPDAAAVMEPQAAGRSARKPAAEKTAAAHPGKRPSTRRRREPPPPGPNADDGGGPGYPHRTIRALGKVFRSVLFRPNVPVEPEIIKAIDAAEGPIHLALYEFKLPGVLDALRRARERGIEVHLILDYSQVYPQSEPGADYKPYRSREIWALLREGFDVKVLKGLSEFGINHNKFAVIEGKNGQKLTIFGSYNWAWTAEHSHYENANFSNDQDRADAYMQYWHWLDSMAQPEPLAREHAWPQAIPQMPFKIAETLTFNGIKLPAVVFSPQAEAGQSTEDWLVKAYDAAQESIDVPIFALRSTKIAEALARAHNDPERRVKVRVIMDESQSTSAPFGPYAQWLAAQGVELKVLAGPDPDAEFKLAQKNHNKVAIIDGKLVATGSANHTKYAAKANYENMNFLDDARDVESYQWVFERMWKRAKPFPKPTTAAALPTDEELEAELRKPPRPVPPPPAPLDPLTVKPRPISFWGRIFPSFAFRPDTPIEPKVVEAIDAARKSVRLAVYEFNLENVMEALRRAKKKGIKVEIVIDHSHVYTRGKDHTGQPRKPSTQIQALIDEGFDVLTLKGEKSGIMHNKYLLVDAELKESLVMFGSYNFAKTAEKNHYENVLFSNERYDVADYGAYFKYMRELGSPIDHDKLNETLNRANAAGGDEDESAAEEEDDARQSKFPPPPQSSAPAFKFNGQTFLRRYFSPQGGILDAWLRGIDAAEESVEVAMFGFYSRRVADALVAKAQQAKAQGKQIRVAVTLDAGQSSLAKFDGTPISRWLAERGIEVRLKAGPNEDGDPMFEKQHNKFMIVDGKLLFTGSFNISDNAENNSFENENLITNVVDVAGFAEYFAVRLFGTGWSPRSKVTQAAATDNKPLLRIEGAEGERGGAPQFAGQPDAVLAAQLARGESASASGPETAAARSRDGRWLAVATQRMLTLHDTLTGSQRLIPLRGHAMIEAWTDRKLSFDPLSQRLAIGNGQDVLLLDLAQGRLTSLLAGGSHSLRDGWESLRSFAFSDDGKVLAVGTETDPDSDPYRGYGGNGDVYLLGADDGRMLSYRPSLGRAVSSLGFSGSDLVVNGSKRLPLNR